jgi:2-polyprenyl-3-methyl-5-hydroxy-6-metoxy-1,4-benzoquinol methylase
VGYTQSPIKEYLDLFYSPHGGVEYQYLEDSYYILNECNDCGLIYQKWIPKDSLARCIYEQWIDPAKMLELHKKYNIRYFIRLAHEIVEVIQSFGAIPSRLQFLDFGMGLGDWCCLAQGFGCDVYGTELSQPRIEYAQASGIKVITWEEIPNYRFDFINTEQVIEHLPKPIETLVHLKRALKPGGMIKISVPNGWDIKKRLRIGNWTAPKGSRYSLNPIAPLEHINCFNHEVIVKMASGIGLKLEALHFSLIKTGFGISLRDSLKAIAKPYYNFLTRRKTTYLFFRNSA